MYDNDELIDGVKRPCIYVYPKEITEYAAWLVQNMLAEGYVPKFERAMNDRDVRHEPTKEDYHYNCRRRLCDFISDAVSQINDMQKVWDKAAKLERELSQQTYQANLVTKDRDRLLAEVEKLQKLVKKNDKKKQISRKLGK